MCSTCSFIIREEYDFTLSAEHPDIYCHMSRPFYFSLDPPSDMGLPFLLVKERFNPSQCLDFDRLLPFPPYAHLYASQWCSANNSNNIYIVLERNCVLLVSRYHVSYPERQRFLTCWPNDASHSSQNRFISIQNLFNVDGPNGSMKAVSHIEGASQRVTDLNLDQWTSR